MFCNNADLILKTGSGSRLKSLLIKSLSQLKLKKIACKLISRTCSDFYVRDFLGKKRNKQTMKYSPGAPSTCIIHLKENKQTKNERLRRGNVYGSGSKNAKKVNKKVVLSHITKTRNYVLLA